MWGTYAMADPAGYDQAWITINHHGDGRWSLDIDRAGPKILINGQLLLAMICEGVHINLAEWCHDAEWVEWVRQTCRLDMPDPGMWAIVSEPSPDGSYYKVPIEPFHRSPGASVLPKDAFIGALLHIYGDNRQAVYKITGFDDDHRAYIAEWPSG